MRQPQLRQVQPTAYLIVSDVPERALSLRLVDCEGKDVAVPISPIRALMLAGDLQEREETIADLRRRLDIATDALLDKVAQRSRWRPAE